MRRLTKDHLVRTVWAAVALVVVVLAGVGPGAAVANAQEPGLPCSQLLVVGLRGSGEAKDGPHDMGRTVGAYVEQAEKQLPANATIYHSLPYPAVPAVHPDYGDSVEAGTLGVVVLVRDRIANCPGIRIGILGYSQGAQAINDALGILTVDERRFVQSVLLLADPISAGDTTYDIAVTVEGQPGSRTGRGILGAMPIPVDLQGRTTDFCIIGDPVCDQRDGQSNLANAVASPIHVQYATCCGTNFPAPNLLGTAFADRLRPDGPLALTP